MKYVQAYHRKTGRKRRIPASWLAPNVFGDNWSPTPSSRGKSRAKKPVDTPEPASAEAGSSVAPAAGDTRKDQ